MFNEGNFDQSKNKKPDASFRMGAEISDYQEYYYKHRLKPIEQMKDPKQFYSLVNSGFEEIADSFEDNPEINMESKVAQEVRDKLINRTYQLAYSRLANIAMNYGDDWPNNSGEADKENIADLDQAKILIRRKEALEIFFSEIENYLKKVKEIEKNGEENHLADTGKGYFLIHFAGMAVANNIEVEPEYFLKKFNQGETSDLFLRLLKAVPNNQNLTASYRFARIFSLIPSYTRRELIKLLKNEKYRNSVSQVLFCREFAQINKSEKERIMKIAGNLPPEDAEKVFTKTAEIISQTEKYLAPFIKRKNSRIDWEEVRKNLIQKAHQIILDFSGEKDIEKLLRNLENSRAEIALLSSLLKVAKDSGMKLSPENIRGMKIETYDVGELAGDKKDEFQKKYNQPVMDMMEASYAKIFEDNPAAFEKVRGNFAEKFKNISQYGVRMLTFQNEMVAFMTMREDEDEKGAVWAESFIVHPEAKHYSLGIAFAKKVMGQEASKHKVKIKVRVDNDAIIETHKKMGFQLESSETFEEKGVKYYNMVLAKIKK